MKKIEAFVPQKVVKNIKLALRDVFKEEFPGITITDVEGCGRGHSNIHTWGKKEFEVDVFPKTKIEIIVADSDVEKVISAIIEAVKKSNLGIKHQGKIFVYNIEDAIRIRDGKRGEEIVK